LCRFKSAAPNRDVLAGHWNYQNFQGVELKDKTLLIIGAGRIGTRVSELAKAFGMRVMTATSKTDKKNLRNMCGQADFITLHCPLNKVTHHLLGEEEFKIMKKGIYLVNASRGGVVDESALLKALNDETIAYASLDVLEQEPPSFDNPCILHPRVLVTPHILWHTKESVQKLTSQCINNLMQYMQERKNTKEASHSRTMKEVEK
jgi:D-3-phosphoglycerate dehydrogenase